ncbi:MAG: gamma carbonic anhydrase family protein [Burkholderiales bacterium]|nr:gamma carbonic anhydrase family protein [Burkholderiales bacterium]
MAIYQLGDDAPVIPASAYVAPEATIIGRVTLGEGASVWPGASIRGDNAAITLGAAVNIQEGAVLHVDEGYPLAIGDGASIGHQAMLHGCTIGANSLVGIQAVVMNGAVIGRDSLVGAGAVVTEGKVFPERSLIVGAPAKVLRTLTDEQVAMLRYNAQHYVDKGVEYKTRLKRIG